MLTPKSNVVGLFEHEHAEDTAVYERVKALADTMALAVGEQSCGELILAGLEIAVRGFRLQLGCTELEATENVEALLRDIKAAIVKT